MEELIELWNYLQPFVVSFVATFGGLTIAQVGSIIFSVLKQRATTAKIAKETREACDQTIQQMEERLKEMSEKTYEIVQENLELKKQITQANKIQYNLLSKIDKIDYANSPSARYEIEK